MEAFFISAHRHSTEVGAVTHPLCNLDLRALLNRLQWTLTLPVSACETIPGISMAAVQQTTVDEQKLLWLDSSCLEHLALCHPTLFSLRGPRRTCKSLSPCPNGEKEDHASVTGDAVGNLSVVFAEEEGDEPTRIPGTLPESTDGVASTNGTTVSVNLAPASGDADPLTPTPGLLTDVLEELVRVCGHASHLESTRSAFDRACSMYTLEHCVEENFCPAAGEFTTSVNPFMTSSCCPAALRPFDDQLGDQGQLFSETWPTLLDSVCRSRLSALGGMSSRLQSENLSPVSTCNIPSTAPATTTTTTQACRSLTTTINNKKHTRIWLDVLRCSSPSSGAAVSSVLATNSAQDNCSSRLALANRKALVCDYLPQLRSLAAGETVRQAVSTKRRFLHYFDRISLYLKRSTRKLLAETVFSSETTAL